MELEIQEGIVKWYNETKGYGFIAPSSGGADVFVHATDLEDSGLRRLNEGDKVTYKLKKNDRDNRVSAGKIKVIGR